MKPYFIVITILLNLTINLKIEAQHEVLAEQLSIANESENVLFSSDYNTPFNTVPFQQIAVDDFLPALEDAMVKGKAEIEVIVNNKEKPTFQNTILALENSGKDITRIFKIISNLNSMETTPEIQKYIKTISPLLTEYRNDISLNPILFAKVKEVYDQRKNLKLDQESDMLLEKSYKGFARNGANLNEENKQKLRDINKDLSELGIRFGENILNETNGYSLYVDKAEDLAGLPEFVLEGARSAAKKDGKEGWKFTLQMPSYSPFVQYADNRELRKEIFLAFNARGYNDNDYNNSKIIDQLVNLRYQKAQILGYETWADYVLEERMANKKDIVFNFLDEVKLHAEPMAKKEMEELTAFAKKNGFKENQLQRWDYSYYTEKLKKEKFAINDEILKPYFKLENVLDGLFELCNQIWGIKFVQNTEIQTWHEDVVVYEIYDHTGEFLAIWYGDYFPRPGKRAGAWNNTLQDQWVQNGVEYRPHVVNVCNFSKPTESKPSLLTFREVETLYHEFGHAVHNIFANGQYSTLTGTSVAWDFVELPSQLMENFVKEPEVLTLFAKHYETGEIIPSELIEKIKASSNFMSGMATLRQLSFGYLDMNWHGFKPTGETVAQLEKRSDLTNHVYPSVDGIAVSTAFSHIFSGGYSSGYYSYKWSEVLDADAFEMFKEQGVLNPAVAKSFRENILSKGGSEKPMDLYKKFRGREPKPSAMLKRSGLLVTP